MERLNKFLKNIQQAGVRARNSKQVFSLQVFGTIARFSLSLMVREWVSLASFINRPNLVNIAA